MARLTCMHASLSYSLYGSIVSNQTVPGLAPPSSSSKQRGRGGLNGYIQAEDFAFLASYSMCSPHQQQP
jgi:hypothetical protein